MRGPGPSLARRLRRAAAAAALLGLAAAAPDPVRIVGGPGGGCIAGAVPLPDEGPGFRTVRRTSSSFWGAPDTVAALEQLAAEAQAAGLPPLSVGDVSRPRGGPMPGGHIGHQRGLDADVDFDLMPLPARGPQPRSLVRPDGRDVDPAAWTPRHVQLLRLAATLPGIDRVLVNPAIKARLCRDVVGDRGWLRRIRPWWGHAAHMHLHFACPAGQAECVDQPPVPPGDGCDATLDWWFEAHPAAPAPRRARPAPPAACAAILGATGPGTESSFAPGGEEASSPAK